MVPQLEALSLEVREQTYHFALAGEKDDVPVPPVSPSPHAVSRWRRKARYLMAMVRIPAKTQNANDRQWDCFEVLLGCPSPLMLGTIAYQIDQGLRCRPPPPPPPPCLCMNDYSP